jgi:hypothetical protein
LGRTTEHRARHEARRNGRHGDDRGIKIDCLRPCQVPPDAYGQSAPKHVRRDPAMIVAALTHVRSADPGRASSASNPIARAPCWSRWQAREDHRRGAVAAAAIKFHPVLPGRFALQGRAVPCDRPRLGSAAGRPRCLRRLRAAQWVLGGSPAVSGRPKTRRCIRRSVPRWRSRQAGTQVDLLDPSQCRPR